MEVINPDQSPLMARARAALRSLGFDSRYVKSTEHGQRGLLTIRGRGAARTFVVEERRTLDVRGYGMGSSLPSPEILGREVAERNRQGFGPSGSLIVAEYIDEAAGAELWAVGMNFLDAAGNANIDLGGVSIEVGGRSVEAPPRRVQRPVPPESRAFSLAGLPVSLLLMSRPDLLRSGATLREISDSVPSSLGKVQEVVKALQTTGYLTLGEGGRIIEGKRMLSAWTEGYLRHRHKWHGQTRFSTTGKARGGLVDLEVLNKEGMWLGGEAAASKRGVPLRPTTTLIYADEIARPTLIQQFKLRKDDDGSIEIARPLWETRAWTGPTAPSVLIRADLLASGDPRQAEAAEEMMARDEDLRRLLGR